MHPKYYHLSLERNIWLMLANCNVALEQAARTVERENRDLAIRRGTRQNGAELVRCPGDSVDCEIGTSISLSPARQIVMNQLTTGSVQPVLLYSLPSRVLSLRLPVGLLLLLLLALNDFPPDEDLAVITS